MEISRIKLNDTLEVPIRCDLYVLSAIQNHFGTIEQFECDLMGIKKSDDSIAEIGEPSIKAILFALPMMIREGFNAEFEENGVPVPEYKDMQMILNISRNYRLIAEDMHEEMRRCFGVKKKNRPKKTTILQKIKRLILHTSK